eukprot:CAMPEP_0114523988 /NCGR_PEP_ID=MMETSP0109-20121206/21597_1 /TAXON_ID=29199 /ORGANISM="Chlorarachnion reptans, Strain CCCM449" /LENGTH=87 /DNA_ID=CAMNT_0001705365 /DNA_START=351 /DNA_END=612 /DNA_ORIENTATION=-
MTGTLFGDGGARATQIANIAHQRPDNLTKVSPRGRRHVQTLEGVAALCGGWVSGFSAPGRTKKRKKIPEGGEDEGGVEEEEAVGRGR